MPTNESLNLHGTLISVFGVGVHLMGEPGIGKSELALAMISRGHQLIADDAPLYAREDGIIYGKTLLERHFLSIRGIGLFDICSLYGASSTLGRHPLNLIIHLKTAELCHPLSHLVGDHSEKDMLGSLIPCVTIPIIKPRNLEVIVETLVKNFLTTKNKEDFPVRNFEDLLQKKMEFSHS